MNDEIENLSKEEIEAELERLQHEKNDLEVLVQMQDNFQHAYKIFLNSVYGFTGTRYSPVFNKDIAESVTLTGQKTIKEMVKFTNDELNKLSDEKPEEWVIAGDTDSVSKDAEVIVDNKIMTISDLFDKISKEGHIEVLNNGTEVAVSDKKHKTALINAETNIKNVSRHKVKKKRYRIEVPGHKPLFITEDHSIMVLRDNEIIECRPGEIRSSDSLIILD